MTEPDHRTPEEGRKALGAAIVHFRDQAGLTTAQLASRSGISLPTLHAIEMGESEPRWGTARRIAEGLEVPLEELIGEAERREQG